MTLKGGETPGKETVHLKGGGTFTAKYKKGGLLSAGYWYGLGTYAPKGGYSSLGKLKRAAQDQRKNHGRKNTGAAAKKDETASIWSLIGLVPAKNLHSVKADKVKPPDSIWRIFG